MFGHIANRRITRPSLKGGALELQHSIPCKTGGVYMEGPREAVEPCGYVRESRRFSTYTHIHTETVHVLENSRGTGLPRKSSRVIYDTYFILNSNGSIHSRRFFVWRPIYQHPSQHCPRSSRNNGHISNIPARAHPTRPISYHPLIFRVYPGIMCGEHPLSLSLGVSP